MFSFRRIREYFDLTILGDEVYDVAFVDVIGERSVVV